MRSSIFDFLEGYDNGTMSDEESSDDEIRPTRSQRSDNEASRRAAMRKRRLQERRNQSKPTPKPKPMVVVQKRVASPPRRQAVPRAVVPSPQPTYHSHGIPGVSLNLFIHLNTAAFGTNFLHFSSFPFYDYD